ncbi:MAG: hypothetical protein FWG74_08445 [Planctomycetes bacterium]|nr:hypothetical protein [Planctomycetota bacterium]
MNCKLQKLEELGTPIMTGIVGAGQMGSGMIAQMAVMKGIRPAVVADINLPRAIEAYKTAGFSEGAFKVTNKLSEANDCLRQGKFVATEDPAVAVQAEAVQAVVDATGVPDIGAKVAFDSIMNQKHMVELDKTSFIYKLREMQDLLFK